MYWDCHTGEAIRELEGSQSGAILCTAVHPGGQYLASGAADGQVRLWLYDEGACFATGKQHTGEVTRCMFTPDGHRLITADTHGTLCFWDIAAAVRQAQSLRTAQGATVTGI